MQESRHSSNTQAAEESGVIISAVSNPLTAHFSRDAAARNYAGGGLQNRYSQNNATLEAFNDNLAETTTVHRLMQYLENFVKKQRKNWEAMVAAGEVDNEEMPLCFVMSALAADGQPVNQILTLLASDPNHEQYDSTIRAFPGGFHCVLKYLNCMGVLFEQHLTKFASGWRNTLPKIKHFLLPHDPRQRELEYPLYLLAHYCVTVIELTVKGGDGEGEFADEPV